MGKNIFIVSFEKRPRSFLITCHIILGYSAGSPNNSESLTITLTEYSKK